VPQNWSLNGRSRGDHLLLLKHIDGLFEHNLHFLYPLFGVFLSLFFLFLLLCVFVPITRIELQFILIKINPKDKTLFYFFLDYELNHVLWHFSFGFHVLLVKMNDH
jgi:hypothetical protein